LANLFHRKSKTLFPATRTRRGQELVGGEGRLLASIGSDVGEKALHRCFVSYLVGEKIYNLWRRGKASLIGIEERKNFDGENLVGSEEER
jgi:hypothetical protein